MGYSSAIIVSSSRTYTETFTSDFEAEWFSYYDEHGDLRLRMTLSVEGVDMSTWDTSGNYGYWVGVGFGYTVMANSDIILC